MAAGMRALAAAALFSCVLAGGDAHAERPYTAIEQRLSAEQMRATGLDQLRPEQLSLLNQLLSNEQPSRRKARRPGASAGVKRPCR